MRWVWRIGALVLALVVALPLGLLAGLNTAPGRRLVERVIARVSEGAITVEGLSGPFPAAPRARLIELRDARGAWVSIHDATLDWSPFALLHDELRIHRLAAAGVSVARMKEASGGAGGGGGLPTRVEIAALHVERLTLEAAVVGVGATFAADATIRRAAPGEGAAALTLHRLDAPGDYHAEGRVDAARLAARLAATEPAEGLLARVAGVANLGAITLTGALDGPWTRAQARLALTAGALRATAEGQLDLVGRTADLALRATAPAMAPRPDLSWQSVALTGAVHGSLTRPHARGELRITALKAAGAAIGELAATVAGDQGTVRLDATARAVRLPGPNPDLLATAPVTLKAAARLDAPGRPLTFALAHPLLALRGEAATEGARRVTAHLDLPDLAPLAAAAGVDLAGKAAADLAAEAAADGAIAARARGTLGLSGGQAPVPALIGPEGTFAIEARRAGATVTLARLDLAGRALTLAAHGAMTGGQVDLDWNAALPDLAALSAALHGALAARGHIAGPTDDLAATADVTGEVAAGGVPRGPLHVVLAANGLPARPAGTLTAEGSLDGAPITLALTAARAADGTLSAAIERGAWKSATAEGTLALAPGALLPRGRLALSIGRLADLSGLAGAPLGGSVAATFETGEEDGRPLARLNAEARDAGLAGQASVARATLAATVRDPTGDPDAEARLDVADLRAGRLQGNGRLTASGRTRALALALTADARGLADATLSAEAGATLDLPGRSLTLARLQARLRDATLRLLAPARLSFADGIAVDRLRLGLAQARLDLAGRLTPTLDLTASLRDLTPEALRAVAPGLQAAGTVGGEARLSGSLARPEGTLRVAGSGLRFLSATPRGLPAARLAADATLAGGGATLRARLAAGDNDITLDGTVPLPGAAPAPPLGLRARGRLDLATINPLIAGAGRQVRGVARLDATVAGTLAAPRVAGALRLAGGAVQDFAQGAHLTDINAEITGAGDTIRLGRVTARAGAGRVSLGGTIGLAGAMPIDLTLTARNATPLASDRLTATLDADLALRGALMGDLGLAGTIKVDRAEFRIPERLPASIPVLQVRRPGQAPPPPPAPPPPLGLDLAVSAPGQVFIRGRGIFAELAGRIHVGGTTAAPVPDGVFRLRRGDLNLAGRTLTFTSGTIRFEGGSALDPALNLVATSSNGAIVATLTVGGFASAPKITLSSVPELPQDEVLAQLLFRQSSGSLSPFQLAEAAAALAQLGGVGGGAFDPLSKARQALGLDRLSVASTATGSGAAVEAGRYVAQGVYVGARQATSGTGTQATVQVDLLRGLKLEADVGTGNTADATGAAATADPYGTSIGLTYEFQY
jgi:translocation and assembly module TamB